MHSFVASSVPLRDEPPFKSTSPTWKEALLLIPSVSRNQHQCFPSQHTVCPNTLSKELHNPSSFVVRLSSTPQPLAAYILLPGARAIKLLYHTYSCGGRLCSPRVCLFNRLNVTKKQHARPASLPSTYTLCFLAHDT